jgi:vacuolar protein sorting-associated protein 13A/C
LEIVLEKPDIILVESVSDINTKALIFSVEGNGLVWWTPEKQVINCSIKNIQLYSCVFNPEWRKDSLIQVLRPCTLNIAGSCQIGQQPNLDVLLSDVRIAITPGIINIVTNTMAALKSGISEKAESMFQNDILSVNLFANHMNMFRGKKIAAQFEHVVEAKVLHRH